MLVGGGHAHMMTLAGIHDFVERGHEVSVIGPSTHHYYSGMGPGMLGGVYSSDDIRFATQHLVQKQGGTFVLGKATTVDPGEKTIFLESGDRIPYDVVSFNAGSSVPQLATEGESSNIFPVKPIEMLREARKRLETLFSEKTASIGVVGGGPSSAEIAGNVWRLGNAPGRHAPNIRIFSGGAFMGRFSQGIRKRVFRSLQKRGVDIREKSRVGGIESGSILLESGESHEMDFIFLALGVKPSRIFAQSGLPTGPDGGLLVNRYLQSPEHPDIFGGGDCIHFQKCPLDKVGVYAVRQNPVLFRNLMARLEGQPLVPFDPGGDYLLIFNMGDGTGVLQKGWLTTGGKISFWIKDYIDKKFIQKFKAD